MNNRNHVSAVSVVGITDPKVQQAVLKLQSNISLGVKRIQKVEDLLTQSVERLKRMIPKKKCPVFSFAIINTHFTEARTFYLESMVRELGVNYTVRVCFRNTGGSPVETSLNDQTQTINGGAIRTEELKLKGSDVFSIMTGSEAVDVFVSVWGAA